MSIVLCPKCGYNKEISEATANVYYNFYMYKLNLFGCKYDQFCGKCYISASHNNEHRSSYSGLFLKIDR